jgi:hypothetical protein
VAGLIVGVDPGQRRDPAGVAVLDGFDVVHLERHLGLPYPELAERVAVLLAQLPPGSLVAGERPKCTGGGYAGRTLAEVEAIRATPIVVDATGVGRAMVDLLEALHLTPIAATLTGSRRLRVRGREMSLPRHGFFRPLVAAVEVGRLRVAEGCPYRAELAQELLAARGGPSYVASRGPGHHGDLACAVSLCLWGQEMARLLPA